MEVIDISEPLRRISATTDNVPGVRRFLRRLTQPIQSFQRLLSNARPSNRARIRMPDEFVKAWLHLLMGLIHSTQGLYLWREHIDNVENLVKTGMRKVIEGLSAHELLERASVLPLELVSLICLELFKGTMANQRDISETYYDYLQALVSLPSCITFGVGVATLLVRSWNCCDKNCPDFGLER